MFKDTINYKKKKKNTVKSLFTSIKFPLYIYIQQQKSLTLQRTDKFFTCFLPFKWDKNNFILPSEFTKPPFTPQYGQK
jgi:hypothetical protein